MKTSTDEQGPVGRADGARLQREADAWLRRLTSGAATPFDVQGFRRWRDTSPAHAQALSEARRIWNLMEPALEPLARRAAARAVADASPRHWPRRALLGAAAGLAGAAAVAVVHPPLALWPSFDEMQADYRTGTGERRTLALADAAVEVDLNTQTALSREFSDGQTVGLQLVSGEASVRIAPGTPRTFRVQAGAGQVLARSGRFEVRHLDGQTCVTCVEGRARVTHPGGTRDLGAGQQLAYDAAGLRDAVAVDVAEWTAWRDGVLVFRRAPLAQVIDEINRYRPGKVLLWARHLAAREVSGRFAIASLDTVLLQIEQSYSLRARALPGGVLILS